MSSQTRRSAPRSSPRVVAFRPATINAVTTYLKDYLDDVAFERF